MAVCDDEAFVRRGQETLCRAILEKLSIKYHISVFETSAAFWAAFSNGERYDLLLLDIMMDNRHGAGANARRGVDPGMDGMELARKIRGYDKDAAIVFVTSNPGYALQGYDVNALHYLMKPLDGGALEKLIESDYQSRFHNQYLVIKTGAQSLRIPVGDILYLENTGRRVVITTTGGTAEYSGKLSELLEDMPASAITRCHVGYAVNMARIRELTRTDAIAMDGKKIPVSRAYTKAAQKAFLRQMWEK
ncbi:MAG: LytTR family DNA-binding domain-containing protein [Oscillospiraceae bacterium]|nr:LytTR family DNA-binding domain-containing protein [Oscillospiraceae bacterium]